MSAVTHAIGGAARSVDRAIARLSSGTTRGQYETLAAVVVLALALALWADPRPATSAAEPFAGGDAVAAPVASAPPVDGGTVVLPEPVVTPASPSLPSTPEPGSPSLDTSPAAPPVRVAALVAPGSPAPGGGRDDATIAERFLRGAGFPIIVVRDDGNDRVCASVVSAGELIVAHADVARPLLDCILAAGRTVLAYDRDGERRTTGDGRVVSTRRGLRVSLLGLAGKNLLTGRVGIVAGETAGPAVDAVVADLRRAGVDVAARSVLPETAVAAAPMITRSVLDLRAAGVETVLFALPVEVQGAWAAQASVALPGVRYVVADAYDAVLNEGYPAVLDGAVALTTLRQTWLPREQPGHPAARAATSCATAAGGVAAGELLSVMTWCQHVQLVGLALRVGGDPATVLRRLRFVSPLTTDLGVQGSTWGPTSANRVVWRSSCSCWTTS